MNASDILTFLDLPSGARVDRRVPKKLLLENGAPTAADKRHINEGIDELLWVAALKPTTIGVPEYRDAVREYLEIAILRLILRTSDKAIRLTELAHRAVPYPVFLMTEQPVHPSISAAHKRWSQGETGKTVLDGGVVVVEWDDALDGNRWPAFGNALTLGNQPRTTLYALYQGWIDTLLAMQAARVTGTFASPNSAEHATARHEALQEYQHLEAQIASVRASAAKETQLSRRVELNLELKRLQATQKAARAKL